MTRPPRELTRRFTLYTTLSWALAPLMGYAIALFFGGIAAEQFFQINTLLLLIPYFLMLAWATRYFHTFLLPVYQWLEDHPRGGVLPDSINQHIKRFSLYFWSLQLLAILALPITHQLIVTDAILLATGHSLYNFILFQLVIAILVGTPGYLLALSIIGQLGNYTGTTQLQMSMRTKMLLVGAYIPLLTMTAMIKYYWWQTHFISPEILFAWAMLGTSGFVITALAIRSLNQSLKPVMETVSHSGASTYSEMASRLYPQSTDEIGYMVQMLGKLFRRLGDQESYVNAVLENTAEAIIVINQTTDIETFNPAAEHLFGYSQHEIRGKPISWLLPELTNETIGDFTGKHESHAKNRQGEPLTVTLNIKTMQSDGDTYYTCLVSDISERKQAELKLIEAEARYRDLVETAHDLVWSMDLDGHWTYLNSAAKRIYGYELNEMLGKNFAGFQSKESYDRDMDAFTRVLQGEELLQYETVHVDKDGNPKHISFNARPLYDDNNKVVRITGTARDITEQKIFERELTYQAQHDSLTGLYNRNYFQQELHRLVTRVARNGAECALLYLDLDQFKYVNDTLGHAAGDRLLLECTSLLKAHIREGDLLARFGGDEFTILLYNVTRDATETVAENIRQLFEDFRFMDSSKTFNVTCSIGITLVNSETASVDEALSQADLACNISKTQGRNCVHTYKPSDFEKSGMAEDIGWATRVRDAIDKDRFQLVYQPIMSVADGLVSDYEVLLRMQTDKGDHIMPSGFIPAAERFGLVNNVDRWTVKTAIYQLVQLHESGLPINFSINLSGHAFGDNLLLPLINNLLLDTRIDPSSLTFEITETAAIADMQAAMRFINSLKDLGCQFALDDFGSGFCSFTYLKHLPVDKLKIDGAFVQSLAHTNVDQAMVQSMNQIAHALGKQTIAEFVENQATLDLLKDIGVDYAQGNFLGKPGNGFSGRHEAVELGGIRA